MDNKKKSRKLNLVTETLVPLQAQDLGEVNGGESVSVSHSGYSVSASRSQSHSWRVSFSDYGVSFSGG
jgi:hypothetical protein